MWCGVEVVVVGVVYGGDLRVWWWWFASVVEAAVVMGVEV